MKTEFSRLAKKYARLAVISTGKKQLKYREKLSEVCAKIAAAKTWVAPKPKRYRDLVREL